ncbi:MAG: TonB-dependent receptor [Bacteroidetes Order II. Incertae sedis bacterium]|nr:TonB-dependent receptor [Bacteroidetes Order II. bacterium]
MLHRFLGFVILLFLCSLAPTYAQNASLSGYVRDASSGETLIQATVLIQGTTTGTVTNTSGYYTLSRLKAGTYTVSCSYIGYKTNRFSVILSEGQALTLDIRLEPEDTSVEVTVTSDREEAEQRNVGVTQMSVSTITRLPSVLQADVFRSLQLLPGIKSSSDFSSGLYIRGGSPDQTLIMLDRTTVYNPTHIFGFFSTFNPDAIKDVKLYKGGYPAEYGGRLGSVVDIYNKEGNRKQVQGVASLGLLSSRIALEGPLQQEKSSWMLAARRSTTEPVLAVLRNLKDEDGKPRFQGIPDNFYFYDFNGKFTYDSTPKDKVSLGFYAGQDNVSIPVGEQTAFRVRYGNVTGNTNWTHIFSPQLFSNFTFTGSRYFSSPSGKIASTEFKRRNEVTEWSAKGDFEYIPNPAHQVQVGFWAGRMTIFLQDSFNEITNEVLDIQTPYVSGYAQETWRPNIQWSLKAGLRANYFGDGNYLRLEPRLSADFTYSEWLRIQAAYGRYYQFLSLITNEAFSGFDVWVTADDGVKPAWGDQFLLGIKTKPFKGWNLDVEGYYRNMNDLFDLDPFLSDTAGLPYNKLFRFGQGYAWGTEFFLEKYAGRLNGFVGYTFGRTWRKFPNINNGAYYPPKYDRTHDLNVTANYDLSSKWTATAVFSYATGQAYTEPLGRTYINSPFGEGSANIGGDVLTVGKLNASRLPAYHRLDVGFTRKGNVGSWGKSELQLQLINAYSHRNIWFYQYDFEANPVKRIDTLQLPILPNIAYTIRF